MHVSHGLRLVLAWSAVAGLLLSNGIVTWFYKKDAEHLWVEMIKIKRDIKALQSLTHRSIGSADTFDLSEGESKAIMEDQVFIGLMTVNGGRATVMVHNHARELGPGEFATYDFAGRECRVRVVTVLQKDRRAVLTNTCSDVERAPPTETDATHR